MNVVQGFQVGDRVVIVKPESPHFGRVGTVRYASPYRSGYDVHFEGDSVEERTFSPDAVGPVPEAPDTDEGWWNVSFDNDRTVGDLKAEAQLFKVELRIQVRRIAKEDK